MGTAESQSFPVSSGQTPLVAKRSTPKGPNDAPGAKRIKIFRDGDVSPIIKPPAIARIVPFPEKPAVVEEQNGEIEFWIVNNDGSAESTVVLTGPKNLFQKQLPKMPKDYIARLVYDRTHLSLAIVKRPPEVIGGTTFREVVGGITFREVRHPTSPVMHLLTYADTYATGYFQKQGFTKDITLDMSIWMGYIKDYEGGTLMQCSMLPQMRYLEVGRMLLKQKETILAKMRPLSENHIIHPPPQQWANGVIPIDPLSIPAIRATGWSTDMDKLSREPRHGPQFNKLRRFLSQIQAHKQAWPFLSPVNKDEVPDYYNVIESPMDLSIVGEKLENDSYLLRKINDLKFIISNRQKYNDATTVYAKCAVKLEKYMFSLIKDILEWSDLL